MENQYQEVLLRIEQSRNQRISMKNKQHTDLTGSPIWLRPRLLWVFLFLSEFSNMILGEYYIFMCKKKKRHNGGVGCIIHNTSLGSISQQV